MMKRSCNDCIHHDVCQDKFKDRLKCAEYICKSDVVEVVRCKDCKHRRENVHRSYCLPTFGLKEITDLNAFCSYGERRDI